MERNSQRRRRDRDDNRIVTVLIVLVLAFAVLTLPAAIWWLMYDFGGFKSSESSMEIIEVFAALVYFHSCINPVVYFVMDRKFRNDVKKMLHCIRPRKAYSLDGKERNQKQSVTEQPILASQVIKNEFFQLEIRQNGNLANCE